MFKNLYKQGLDKLERQESRRKVLLREQKLKRLQHQDECRECKITSDGKKIICTKPKSDLMGTIQLQTSEWLKQKPDDLANWLLVPCPKGQRCLVVAEKGKTIMFSKSKKYCTTFLSFLPGGGLYKSGNDCCILDCIFDRESNTFYVLDALYYIVPLIECDTEFRFFWLKSKFNEMCCLDEKYHNEDVKSFQLLQNYDFANEETLAAVLHTYPLWPGNQPPLDGFLFYHKGSHYVFGVTPLVCWLFPFMLPDLLQLSVCSLYKAPANYCHQNPLQFMDEFDEHIARKRNKKKDRNELDLQHCDALESLLTAEKLLEMDETY